MLVTNMFSYSCNVYYPKILSLEQQLVCHLRIPLIWKKLHRINPLLHRYSFWCINNRQLLKTLWEKEQFLLFPQYFLFNQIIVSPFDHIFDIISLFAAELEEPKIGISGKEFNFVIWLRENTCHLRQLYNEG